MKNLKVKTVLFSLLAMTAVAIFLTSCEQEEVLSTDLHEVSNNLIDLPLDGIETQIIEDTNLIEDRASCNCSRIHTSRRTSSSSYLYCHNGAPVKEFILQTSNGQPVDSKESSTYYTYFSGLQSGHCYRFQVRMTCPDGSYYCSSWKYFVQPY